ncbi:hypothetical protein DAPPUDRAFT_253429 [Daphnia pulex]|uniref:Uncharacterized protein n=1 Tax=Daphnia pulex TaxID=6669 RepID=E9H4T5_DAPPU|nr:hypothetical protein DAPPUDRAFT_253429 [Daphnia pulex]|eukprot:EFX73299.1 hypothetical protein DAPPUDRAFT_253429 [Daphnia pulex]
MDQDINIVAVGRVTSSTMWLDNISVPITSFPEMNIEHLTHRPQSSRECSLPDVLI